MKNKGLTLSIIFEGESANYGESIGNVQSLKKISRGKGDQYTYISRQALRYNIINQMNVDNTPIGLEGSVLQFHPDAKIDDYPEIDLFGYMKTEKKSSGNTRPAVVRLSNAISLETFKGDTDFLTNKGLLDRYNLQNKKDTKTGGNISQAEIHRSYYAYTITADLDSVGVDDNEGISLDNKVKSERIEALLDSLRYLYRDIKGRREDFSPLFAIGGVYSIKNPIFMNALSVKNNELDVGRIKDKMSNEIEAETHIGLVKGVFDNENMIKENLNVISINEFFDKIKKDVRDYYEGD